MIHHPRYQMLDACRGVAACLVACFHFGTMYQHGAGQFVPNGFLAVDFFFVLSGFVIDRSYSNRLDTGMTLPSFIERRTVRLYPLYIFGQGLGVLRQIVGMVVQEPRALSPLKVVIAAFFGLFMLPSPFAGTHIFALNSPSWSIFFELIANITFAAFAFRLSYRYLALTTVLAFVALCLATALTGQITDFGQTWHNFPGGVCRVTFSFLAGVFVSRSVRCLPVTTNWSYLVVAVLAAGIALPQIPASLPESNLYGLMFIGLIAPCVITAGARFDCRTGREVCAYLGDVSYPLYIVHPFLIDPVMILVRKTSMPAGITSALYLVVSLCTATVLLYAIDKPARRAILAGLRGKKIGTNVDAGRRGPIASA